MMLFDVGDGRQVVLVGRGGAKARQMTTCPPTRSTWVADPEAKRAVDQWLRRFG